MAKGANFWLSILTEFKNRELQDILVTSKDQKEFMKQLKPVYYAPVEKAAHENLKMLEDTWAKKYPLV